MPVQDNAERIGIEVMGKLGVTAFSAVAAWSAVVLDIITGLRTQMNREQFTRAVDVFERWGMAVPFSIETGPPRVWMRSEVWQLKRYFLDVLSAAERIRISRAALPLLPGERDILLVAEAEQFCRKTLSEIDRLSVMGDISCEAFVFEDLIFHCKELMRVVMGDALTDQFAAEYDIAMRSLRDTTNLINAPKV